MSPAGQPRHPAFYPLLILTGLAALCEVALVLGAALGRFSWTFAIVWLILLALHMGNITLLARRSR